jgi:hypothetical protein
MDEVGPVAGAVVRVQATENWTSTDGSGQFILGGLEPDTNVFITAWAPGFYVVGEEAVPGDKELEINLHALMRLKTIWITNGCLLCSIQDRVRTRAVRNATEGKVQISPTHFLWMNGCWMPIPNQPLTPVS